MTRVEQGRQVWQQVISAFVLKKLWKFGCPRSAIYFQTVAKDGTNRALGNAIEQRVPHCLQEMLERRFAIVIHYPPIRSERGSLNLHPRGRCVEPLNLASLPIQVF